MPVSANYNQIPFQTPLRSKPVRDNFTDIQTDVNDLQTQVTSLSSSTSTSEIIASRDGFATLDDRLHFTQQLLGNGVITYARTIDDCETTTNWFDGTNMAISVTTTYFVEGSKSVENEKNGTSSTQSIVECEFGGGATDLENKTLKFELFIKDSTTLAKISTISLKVADGLTVSTKYNQYDIVGFNVGWNSFAVDLSNPDSTLGSVDMSIADILEIEYNSTLSSDTWANSVYIDYFRYEGDELKIVERPTPDMTVTLKAGKGIINGYGVLLSSDTQSGTMTAPSSNPRIDLVCIDKNGTARIITGAENASPVRPDTPFNYIILAEIYHRTTSTSIKNTDDSTNSYITDLRQIQSNNPVFLSGSGVPLGAIIAVHPEVKSQYLPDAIGNNYEACDGVALFPTEYFTAVHTNVPDLTDDRFLMGDYGYNYDGSNEHNHQIIQSTTELGSWQSDGTTEQLWDQTNITYTTGGSDFDKVDLNPTSPATQYSKNQDSKPKYFSVLYYIRVR